MSHPGGLRRLSVVIPTWNRAALVVGALEHLLSEGVPAWGEVVVVDDGSTDDTVSRVGREFPGGRLIAREGMTRPFGEDCYNPFGRAPGYPAFLAVAGVGREASTSVPAMVKITQSLAGALGILLAAAVAARLAGPCAGLVATVLTAVYPPLVWISSYALGEAVCWPLARAASLRTGW